MKPKFLLRAILATVAGTFIVLAVVILRSDPQGEENSDCFHAKRFLSMGPDGMSASGHITACSTPAASIVTYIYLHRSGALPTSKDLVFRYSQRATIELPKIHWTDGKHLVVEAMHVETVSKEKKSLADVSIEYKIAEEKADSYP